MKFIKELLTDGAMPASVIKHKEKIRMMSDAERKEYFAGKGKDATARMERTHVMKPGSYTKYFEETVKEDAAAGATSGGDVAGARGSLFGGPIIKRKVPKTEKVTKLKFSNAANWNLRESFMASLLEFSDIGGKFNSADVVSKLTAAEKQEDFDRNTIPFGIEDEDGNIVKVYVRPDQANDFEKVLGSTVADTAVNNQEIAEILFNLKDKFDIVHVEWPALPEDEEEAAPIEGEGDLEMSDAESAPTDLGAEGDLDVGGEAPAEDDSSVKSALDKVIDMLKADAEARKAEAEAKEQEAKAKEAEYAAKMAEQKVKSEEEVLDMETFYKEKGEERKEAQKLMKLAKYRHDLARTASEDME
jgi:hypothetical protein